MCQCLYSGDSHPDKEKRMKVVTDHLYLLSFNQLKHIMHLKKHWKISYSDDSLNISHNELSHNLNSEEEHIDGEPQES